MEYNIESFGDQFTSSYSTITVDTKVERVRKKRNVFERAANALAPATNKVATIKRSVSKPKRDHSSDSGVSTVSAGSAEESLQRLEI